MAKRKSTQQTKHNNKVRSLANQLSRQGWKVQADLPAHDQPDPIGKKKHVPDLVATKGGAKRIIEVETPETVNKDKAQHESFSRSAGQQKRTTFKIEETD